MIGHADRRRPLEAYLTGLLLAEERGADGGEGVDPRHVSRTHQSMHHFVAKAPWDDRAVLAVARGLRPNPTSIFTQHVLHARALVARLPLLPNLRRQRFSHSTAYDTVVLVA